jgi:DNA-nicking Smr family endonuclease
MNNQDDKNLFRDLYGDIERVQHDRVPEYRHKPNSRINRKPVSRTPAESAINPRPDIDHMPAGGHEHYTYRAEGIQNKVMQKLRRGQMFPGASVDLHGMTREQALSELQDFIGECRSRRITTVHVVHGKGFQSSKGKPVLKPTVALWLQQMPEVLAYTPCLPKDGGDGAMYVLLKK